MGYTEFYCDPAASGASNLNAGSASPATPFIDTGGNWDGTEWYTISTGSFPGSVVVGGWASLYASDVLGISETTFIARIEEIDTGPDRIRLSTTARAGTPQGSGTDNVLRVGGYWKGPFTGTGANNFPLAFATGALTNAAGDPTRVNFKAGTFTASSGTTRSQAGPIVFEGYTSAPGDGGRFALTMSASGVLLRLSSGCSDHVFRNAEFKTTASSGTGQTVLVNGGSRMQFIGCVAHDARGAGFQVAAAASDVLFSECETYLCNQSGGSATGAFHILGDRVVLLRCVAHDNSAAATDGFRCTGSGITLISCIADTHPGAGFYLDSPVPVACLGCDAYLNTGGGFVLNPAAANQYYVENSNVVSNLGDGFVGSGSATKFALLLNCGTSSNGDAPGQDHFASALPQMNDQGRVAYTISPWADAATGNFSIIRSESQGKGRAVFVQTQANYGGTLAYADIGAAQHQSTPFAVSEVAFVSADDEAL